MEDVPLIERQESNTIVHIREVPPRGRIIYAVQAVHE